VYQGSIPGRFGDRKPPSSAYATQSPILHLSRGTWEGGNFWDGRATGAKLGNPAADQAQGPFLNPAEQALPAAGCVVYRVCTGAYETEFRTVAGQQACSIAWPANIDSACSTPGAVIALGSQQPAVDATYDLIARLIAAYEASPESNAFTSKFDYWRKGQAQLTKQEHRGFALFQGKGKCAKCHTSTGKQPLFTDYTYDNLGLPKNPANPVYNAHPKFVDLGLGGFLSTISPASVYKQELGKVKVPTLRNVDKRPAPGFIKAFGHNGFFKSLESIVHFYNTRDVETWPAPEYPDNVNTAELGNLRLSSEDEAAIVAFMKTLTDGYQPDPPKAGTGMHGMQGR
jgi:cytochrome c peroxidase